jgi:hypothetical protein
MERVPQGYDFFQVSVLHDLPPSVDDPVLYRDLFDAAIIPPQPVSVKPYLLFSIRFFPSGLDKKTAGPSILFGLRPIDSGSTPGSHAPAEGDEPFLPDNDFFVKYSFFFQKT